MNPDTTRCKHDMPKGQCGICDDKTATKQVHHKKVEDKPTFRERLRLDGMAIHHLDGNRDNNDITNLTIVPISANRQKVTLKPRRLNGRSSKKR